MNERDDTEDVSLEGRTILHWMLENRDTEQNICHDFTLFNIMQFQVPLLKVKGNQSSKHRMPTTSQVSVAIYKQTHTQLSLYLINDGIFTITNK